MRHNRIAILALALPLGALADINQTTTLASNTALNLDTGATAGSGGDLLWTGSAITLQGSAKAFNLGNIGAQAFGFLTQSTLQPVLAGASSAPIPSSTLAVGDVFAVQTNGSHAAKVLVTDNSAGSITLQFTTYGATGGSGGGSGGPTITAILNNSSRIPSGFPNYGIAPSSLFIIQGSGLADPGDPVLQDSTKGIPLTLNGASISVTVSGTTVHPALYYTSPAQLAAVLPASTPPGSGTLTVTYKNQTSAPAAIQVVPNALGITTYNGSALATDALSGALLSYTSSGKPGQIVILWSTGLGSDPADSDTTYTSSPHQVDVPLQIYFGGVQATSIAYKGASVYPGVSVIGVTIPQGVPTGCYVPLAAVAGNVVSNIVTLPIAANGGVCSDANTGLTGTQISQASGQTNVRSGGVYVFQATSPGLNGSPSVLSAAAASFQQISGANYANSGTVSIGGCLVTQTFSGTTPTVTALDAGTITVNGPGGVAATLQKLQGIYVAQLDAGAIPNSGGTFTFNGAGGADVGKFTASVNFPSPLLSWTNQSAAASVDRTQGLPVTWSGGAAGTYVSISGSSSSGNATGSFTCIAPVEAQQFTVPAYILLGLPAGQGGVTVGNSTPFSSFSASGLDVGYAFGAVSFEANSTYK